MAENEEQQQTEVTPPPDGAPEFAQHIPDQFKREDGAFDFEGFRSSYDELSSYKSQADEAAAALPKTPDEYVFALGEGHVLPEGFDPVSLATKDEEGKDVAFDPASMIDPKDPDIAAVQAMMHEIKAPAGIMQKIAGLMVNREIRGLMEAVNVQKEELKSLGPDMGKARINTISHALAARMPAAESKALLDGATSADAIRALEKLIKPTSAPPSPIPPGGAALENMTPREMIALGVREQMTKT